MQRLMIESVDELDELTPGEAVKFGVRRALLDLWYLVHRIVLGCVSAWHDIGFGLSIRFHLLQDSLPLKL
jgi:hypothetical protein